MRKLAFISLLCVSSFAQHIDWNQLANPPGWTPLTSHVFTVTGGYLSAGPTYVSGSSSCTNGTQVVTFNNKTNGTNATGTITVSGGHPTGAVTLTSGGDGYATATPPTTGTVATCTGTATFSGGTVVGSVNSGYIGPVFQGSNTGTNPDFQTYGGSSVGYGNGTWQMQGDNMLGMTLEPAGAANSGGYMTWWPLNYTPNNAGGACLDIYGNAVQWPVVVPGMPTLGYGTNQTLNTNTTNGPLNVALHSGGSSYSNGETFTVNGSSGVSATGTITATSGGSVTAFTITNYSTNNGYTINATSTNIGTTRTSGAAGSGFTVDLDSFQGIMAYTASPLTPVYGSCVGSTPVIPQNNLYTINAWVPITTTQGFSSFNRSYAAFQILSPDGLNAGGAQANTFYAGWLAHGEVNYNGTIEPGTYLTSLIDAGAGPSHYNTNCGGTFGSPTCTSSYYGSSYQVGDEVTVNGGTTLSTVEITGVSAGHVTTYQVLTQGAGYSMPASSVATTCAAGEPCHGTGFKLNLTDLVNSVYVGGSMYPGTSCEPPISSASNNITNYSNVMSDYLTVVAGMFYWNNCFGNMQVYNGTSWVAMGSGAAAGPLGAVQYNTPLGTLDGVSGFVYTPASTDALTVTGSPIDSRILFINSAANSVSNTESIEFDLNDSSAQQLAAEIQVGFSTVTHASNKSFIDFYTVSSTVSAVTMQLTPTTIGAGTGVAFTVDGGLYSWNSSGAAAFHSLTADLAGTIAIQAQSKNAIIAADVLQVGDSAASGATYDIAFAQQVANPGTAAAHTANLYLNTSDQLVASVNNVAASQICLANGTGCPTSTATIGGSIASPQVAYGSGSNTIAGTNNFEWSANTLTVQGASASIVVGDGTNLGLVNIDDGSSCTTGNTQIEDNSGTWTIDCKGNIAAQTLVVANSVQVGNASQTISTGQTGLIQVNTNTVLSGNNDALIVLAHQTTENASAYQLLLGGSIVGTGGAGGQLVALGLSPTFAPTATVGDVQGLSLGMGTSPPAGVNIGTAYGTLSYISYGAGHSTGSVTNGVEFAVYTPFTQGAGSALPTTQYGLRVYNQGLSGITTSYGFYIDAQSGSTTNIPLYVNGVATITGLVEFLTGLV